MTRRRVEADREDLLAEAVNLPERVEFQVAGIANSVTIGRNRLGDWCFYLGSEPMYRFDSDGGLRRAARDSKLYRTQGQTLAELTRVRLDQETQLQRRDLGVAELAAFLELARGELRLLEQAFTSGQVQALREVGTSPEFHRQLQEFLVELARQPIHLAAGFPTKRH